MSEANGKVCCNCRHNIRENHICYMKGEPYNRIRCKCKINGRRLNYSTVMSGWCKHWSKEEEEKEK